MNPLGHLMNLSLNLSGAHTMLQEKISDNSLVHTVFSTDNNGPVRWMPVLEVTSYESGGYYNGINIQGSFHFSYPRKAMQDMA